jgi:uncharacterized OB-fold protein
MFCSKCGAKVEENAKFCSNCGSTIAQNAPQQPAMSYSGEVFSASVNLVYPDGHNEVGKVDVSANEIIFFQKSKVVLLAFGMLGNAIEKGKEKVHINTADIVGGQRTRIGLNSNVYQITLRNGQVYKLCVNNPAKLSYFEKRFG